MQIENFCGTTSSILPVLRILGTPLVSFILLMVYCMLSSTTTAFGAGYKLTNKQLFVNRFKAVLYLIGIILFILYPSFSGYICKIHPYIATPINIIYILIPFLPIIYFYLYTILVRREYETYE